jgi:uncharacterized coiled-coil protein SlyX
VLVEHQPVTYQRDNYWSEEVEEPDEPEPPRWGMAGRFLFVAILAAVGSGSAFLWRAAGWGSFQAMVPATTSTAMAEKAVGQGDFEALRIQIVELTQLSQQALAAQQAEIKRLSDQIIALSSRLDVLQRPVTPSPAPTPVKPPGFAPKKNGDAKPAPPARPTESKPIDSRPAGATSTGGAPLQLTR